MRFEVENGSFHYPGQSKVLFKDISFTLTEGQILTVLGPNGVGKTTLLRCILGFLPWTSGTTRMDGEALGRIPPQKLWRNISYVPQARHAPAGYRVEDMVLLGRTGRLPTEEDLQSAREALHRCGISHLADRSCNTLSGGEYQMVLIARALAAKPKLLVLDEPESNLDFKNQLLVLELLQELSREGLACIFNTHYPAHALRWGTHTLMLSPEGQSLFGTAAELITRENMAAIFGVQAVIGGVETEDTTYADVVPIGLSRESTDPERQVTAVLTIVLEKDTDPEAMNRILYAYRELVAGRMGLPEISIITLTLKAAREKVQGLTAALSALPGLHIKTIYLDS